VGSDRNPRVGTGRDREPRFDIQVPQEYLSRVTQAESVLVTLDASPGASIEAAIEAIVPVKDNVSRTFLTRLELRDTALLAAPGMSGTAEISFLTNNGDTVQIPRDAVVRFPDGSVKVVPVQMIPDLDVRIISIETGWPGATPQDVEKEILIEQEDYLRGMPNLKRMTSLASTGRAQIELEFPFGTDSTRPCSASTTRSARCRPIRKTSMNPCCAATRFPTTPSSPSTWCPPREIRRTSTST
jgi:hypothetical protein